MVEGSRGRHATSKQGMHAGEKKRANHGRIGRHVHITKVSVLVTTAQTRMQGRQGKNKTKTVSSIERVEGNS